MQILRSVFMMLLGVLLGVGGVLGYLQYQPGAGASASAPPALVRQADSPTATAQRAFLYDEQLITSLYERVSPSVVSVTQEVRAPRRLGQEFVPRGTGSGFIIDTDGYILTNYHVVADAAQLEVTLKDGTQLRAQLVGSDPLNDLALIKIDPPPSGLTPVVMGDSDNLKVGQFAMAIGNPFGFEGTATVGIISGLGRVFGGTETGRPIRNLIQTDAAINPGNSGGPLFNADGEVIGINSMIESPVRANVGVGFAIPSNTATRLLPELKQGGEIKHAWLGISGRDVTPELATNLGLGVTQGVLVVEVVDGSPAARAGLRGADPDTLRGGDVITAVDGQPVNNIDALVNLLDAHRPGDRVSISVWRGGGSETVEAQLASWPEQLN